MGVYTDEVRAVAFPAYDRRGGSLVYHVAGTDEGVCAACASRIANETPDGIDGDGEPTEFDACDRCGADLVAVPNPWDALGESPRRGGCVAMRANGWR